MGDGEAGSGYTPQDVVRALAAARRGQVAIVAVGVAGGLGAWWVSGSKLLALAGAGVFTIAALPAAFAVGLRALGDAEDAKYAALGAGVRVAMALIVFGVVAALVWTNGGAATDHFALVPAIFFGLAVMRLAPMKHADRALRDHVAARRPQALPAPEPAAGLTEGEVAATIGAAEVVAAATELLG
jgi:hypothetical protein